MNNFLIIDDDMDFSGALCRALQRRGHSASFALNVEDALAKSAHETLQHIVLDLNLASWGQSGLNLIPALRKTCPQACIVLLTGYASIATAVEAIKLGANDYLAKPVDVETLLACFNQRKQTPSVSDGSQPGIEVKVPSQPLSVDRLEWEHIQRVLHEHAGNISATARALKMHRRTLQRKLGKHPVRE